MGAFKSSDINEALETWKRGGLVAMPTETVYGLAAPIDDLELIKRIFSFKERPFFDPLIVHIARVEDAVSCSSEWSEVAQALADKFWPGPLTLVVKKADKIDSLITSGLDTVGLRFPKHPVAIELIKVRGPLAAPSANKFTKTSPTSPDHVMKNFQSEDVCVLESLAAQVGIESTIVQVCDENKKVEVLRPGLITSGEIEDIVKVFGHEVIVGESAFDKAVKAPGQFNVHYRPDYPLFMGESCCDDEFDIVELDLDPYVSARRLYALMQEDLPSQKKGRFFIIPSQRHTLEAKEKEVWDSILNRLSKAIQKS